MALEHVLVLTLLTPAVFGVTLRCFNPRRETIACAQTLQDRLDEILAPFDLTHNMVDRDNATELRILVEQTKAVVCDSSNFRKIKCILDYFDTCPELLREQNVLNEYFGQALVSSQSTSTSEVCDHFTTEYCQYRKSDMNDCFEDIVDDAQTADPDSTALCASTSRNELSCMFDKYKECRAFISITDGTTLSVSVTENITSHRWETFISTSELCGCYEGVTCYGLLLNRISKNALTVNSVSDIYTNDISRMETLCANDGVLGCSRKVSSSACELTLDKYTRTIKLINQYQSVTNTWCDDIAEDEFIDNKNCIIEQLTDVYHPCVADSSLPSDNLQCSDVQKLYNCVRAAFPRRRCNGNFADLVYDIIRVKYGTLPACELSNAMTTMPSVALTTVFAIWVYIYGNYLTT